MDNNIKNINSKNIVFIIGNGFDLNLGLKTSYYDFVKWYTKIDSNDNQPVQFLKDHIDIEDFKWGDLELKLGEYTKLFNNHDEFYKAYCDMGEKLMLYLSVEENKYFEKTNIQKRAIAHGFIDDILVFLTKNKLLYEGKIQIDIITFNYTTILDNIVEFINDSEDLKKILRDKNINIRSLCHCHGNLKSQKICFGVDNYSQIKNQRIFEKHIRYMEQMIKPKRNDYLENTDKDKSIELIHNADCVIVYGCSLGKTDEFWNEQIKIFLGAKEVIDSYYIPKLYFGELNDEELKRNLYMHSYKQKPISTFDADSIEFEDEIRDDISFKDDRRIKIVYSNIFESIKKSVFK